MSNSTSDGWLANAHVGQAKEDDHRSAWHTQFIFSACKKKESKKNVALKRVLALRETYFIVSTSSRIGLTNRHASAEAGTSHESVLLASIRAFFDGDGMAGSKVETWCLRTQFRSWQLLS
jgi:hypothetical protein